MSEKQTSKPTLQREIFKILWDFSVKYKWHRRFAIFGAATITLISSFGNPLILSKFLSLVQNGTATFSNSIGLVAAFAIIQFSCETIGWRLVIWSSWFFEVSARRDIFMKIFKKLSKESMEFHSNHFSGSLVSQTNKLANSFESFWDTIIFSLVPLVVSIASAVVILWQYLWQYSLIVLVVSILFMFVVFFGSKFMRERNKLESQASTKMTGQLADTVTNILTVKSFGNEKLEEEKALKGAEDWRKKSFKLMNGFLITSSSYSTLTSILMVSAFVSAIYASEHKIIDVAVIYLIVTYTMTVCRQLWQMNNVMRTYYRVIGDSYDMTEILITPTKVVDNSTKKLSVTNGNIKLKNVTFKYDDVDKHIFDKFNLDIKAGQKIGLVGPSGSGKSTLVKLLLRFNDIEDGKISIDNQDISKVSQESLRKLIAYVPQEPMLFHRTIRENIAYSKPNASIEEVKNAAREANALEFIEDLENGFDTVVGERGTKLSGGQRQRIAIARAILKDAPILILDEATSALDSESEKLIQDSLDNLMKKRTSIVIAHRLSTIAKLDRIIVLEHGKITEDGSHQKLLNQGGTYCHLWNHQSGGFLEEDDTK